MWPFWMYTLSTRGDLHVIGCCNNQSRTSSAQWPARPARGMRIVPLPPSEKDLAMATGNVGCDQLMHWRMIGLPARYRPHRHRKPPAF